MYVDKLLLTKSSMLFQAAKTEYHTFSSLVRVLVKYCTSELDKARAIFRYFHREQDKLITNEGRISQSLYLNTICAVDINHLSRYITEKKFEHRNWFLFYPEEGNTRGAPTDLLRSLAPAHSFLNGSRAICAGALSLELRRKHCCTRECAPTPACTLSSSKDSARFSHLITVPAVCKSLEWIVNPLPRRRSTSRPRSLWTTVGGTPGTRSTSPAAGVSCSRTGPPCKCRPRWGKNNGKQ